MRGRKKLWQQWQLDYLVANYADTRNEDIIEMLGVSRSTVYRMTVHLGLQKPRELWVQNFRDTIRRERLRIKWGLEQRTKLRLGKEPRKRADYRHALKKRGYIIPVPGSREVYYTDESKRSALVERRATSHGLTIKPYNNEILLQR